MQQSIKQNNQEPRQPNIEANKQIQLQPSQPPPLHPPLQLTNQFQTHLSLTSSMPRPHPQVLPLFTLTCLSQCLFICLPSLLTLLPANKSPSLLSNTLTLIITLILLFNSLAIIRNIARIVRIYSAVNDALFALTLVYGGVQGWGLWMDGYWTMAALGVIGLWVVVGNCRAVAQGCRYSLLRYWLYRGVKMLGVGYNAGMIVRGVMMRRAEGMVGLWLGVMLWMECGELLDRSKLRQRLA